MNLSLLQRVQNGSGADPVSCSIETWNFHGIKPEHSFPSGVQVRNEWSSTSTPPCLLCVRKNKFTRTFTSLYLNRPSNIRNSPYMHRHSQTRSHAKSAN